MRKRILSILLILCMVLCLVPTAVFAEESPDITGTGTAEDPFLIYTAQGLKQFRDMVNAGGKDFCAKLMNDIVLNDGSFDENGNWSESGTPEQWTPISNYYSGTFDGNGKTIRGLYINGLNDHCGLFGLCGSCCTIRNLTVTGYVCASASMSVGGIVGFATPNTYITNCQNSCTVKGGDRVGGIAGAASSNSLISGCNNSGRISGIAAVGGIVGDLWGFSGIKNCSNIGAVTGTGDEVCVGGLAGRSHNSEISNSYSVGALSGSGNQVYVGGIAGETSGRNGHYSCWLEDTAEEAAGYGTAFKDLYARSKSDFADGTVLNLLKHGDTENAWNSCGYLAAAGMTLPLLSWQTADAHTHDYQWKYDNTEHWKECSCGFIEQDSKAIHEEVKGICTDGIKCKCGYEMHTATGGHSYPTNWSPVRPGSTHSKACTNPGCGVTKTESCTGGTATCTEQATCDVCHEKYGEKNPENHTGTAEWIWTATTHRQEWNCCHVETVAVEGHEWKDGVCTECNFMCNHSITGPGFDDADHDHKCDICDKVISNHNDADSDHICDICNKAISNHNDTNSDHICDICNKVISNHDDADGDHICDICNKVISNHSGGTATCTDKAVCEICGEKYGNTNPDNHTGTTEWIQTATKHTQKYKCCGAVTVAEEDHEWENGVCTECGYGCEHTGGTATCTEQATCEICGEKYGDLKPHSYSTEWSTDETGHWHECTECGAKTDEAEHTDTDKNHKCDICEKVLSECADNDKDHKCDLCGKVLSEHSGGTATCKEKAKCEVCGESYGELNAKNHANLKHIDAKAATKTSEGNIEYWYCDGCGKYFADKDGNKEITKAQTVTAKLPDENPTSPKTGDASNLALCIALLFISGGAVTVTTVVSKKKRQKN